MKCLKVIIISAFVSVVLALTLGAVSGRLNIFNQDKSDKKYVEYQKIYGEDMVLKWECYKNGLIKLSNGKKYDMLDGDGKDFRPGRTGFLVNDDGQFKVEFDDNPNYGINTNIAFEIDPPWDQDRAYRVFLGCILSKYGKEGPHIKTYADNGRIREDYNRTLDLGIAQLTEFYRGHVSDGIDPMISFVISKEYPNGPTLEEIVIKAIEKFGGKSKSIKVNTAIWIVPKTTNRIRFSEKENYIVTASLIEN